MIRLFVGYDPREAVAYHTFCQSVISRCSLPVSFIPINGEQRDGSNQFIYARFLVPYLCGFQGKAIFVDGDMTCLGDLAELWNIPMDRFGVRVVQHEYQTKFPTKYWGQKNEDYPRKNWSSVILWDCGHFPHRKLTPEFIMRETTGAFLHRFEWMDEDRIGHLPMEWNWLAKEYPPNPDAKLVHHTIGLPIDPAGEGDPWAGQWNEEFLAAMRYRK